MSFQDPQQCHMSCGRDPLANVNEHSSKIVGIENIVSLD